MQGITKTIRIEQLINYFENPRHAISTSEEDTLRNLFEAVGVQYMLNLADDIHKNGLLGNQQIVVVFSEELQKYVVYEGNRRIAAIKLLLNPERFSFLERTTIERAKKIGQDGNIPVEVNCYITNEEEAFLIMERLHSGEDKGRGVKQWTSREKEVFKVRQNHQKKMHYLIDFYCNSYFKGVEITGILPFTTLERIFNNREIKKKIGLDTSDEQTFTKDRMRLVIEASKWIKKEADSEGVSVTRLFNKARTIEQKLLPWLDEYMRGINMEKTSGATEVDGANLEGKNSGVKENAGEKTEKKISEVQDDRSKENVSADTNQSRSLSSGGSSNLPYFFQGIDYSHLDPNDASSHGISEICKELQYFSDRKHVATYPIAAAFLVRAAIEQSIIYYSKKHKIQGQNKYIWDEIKSISKLSNIIKKYKTSLPNYITDEIIRQYFNNLFGNYESTVDPLNWVVHRPEDFQLDSKTLIELPRKGLLRVINYLIS